MPISEREALDVLTEAARKFSTEADYTVSANTEEEFAAALNDAEEVLQQPRGTVDRCDGRGYVFPDPDGGQPVFCPDCRDSLAAERERRAMP